MAYDTKMELEPGFLKLTLYGTETIGGTKSPTMELVLKECAAHRYERVLVDARNLTTYPGTVEAYEFGKHLLDAGFNRSVRRLAFIHNPKADDVARFFETICHNRGVNIRAFADPGAAIEWLTE
jgi:hypothetical protein